MNDGFFNIQILGYEDKEIRAPREPDAYSVVQYCGRYAHKAYAYA
jgi:hypothetical protein